MVVQNEAFKSSMVSFKGGDAPDAEFISTVIKISYLFGNADGLPQAAAILCEWAQSLQNVCSSEWGTCSGWKNCQKTFENMKALKP